MPSVKQRGINYNFLSLWYDSTWDWTTISWPIGENFSLGQFFINFFLILIICIIFYDENISIKNNNQKLLYSLSLIFPYLLNKEEISY